MEYALSDRERHFRLLYEQAPLAYQSLDDNGCLLDVNQAWLALLGYACQEDVLGRWFGSFLTEKCQALFRERFPQFKAAGETHGVEFDLVRKDGTRIVCAFDGKIAHDAEGRFDRTHCIVHDVTAVRQAEFAYQRAYAEMEEKVEQRTATLKAINWELRQEISQRAAAEDALRAEKERYRTLMETIPHGIVELDTAGVITFANATLHRIYGYAPGELLGKRAWEVVTPEAESLRLKDILAHLLAEQPPPTPRLSRRENRRGEPLDLQVAWNYKRNEAGKLTGFVAVITDVTEQRRAEEQAQQRLNELAHVGRLATMGEMDSGLAHELNQPLAAIANYAHVCRHHVARLRGKTAGEVGEAIQLIAEQAQRAGEIIRHLREFVRRAASSRSTAEVNDLVRDVVVLLEVEARMHGVRVELALGDSLPQVRVDRIQIEQVIANLVKNAMEAVGDLPDGLRLVTIGTARADPAVGVEVTVSDSGPGVAAADLGRLFEPFYTTKPGGMGLGLSISRSIVEAHGGRLQAAAHPDRGMTLRFSLPVSGRGGAE